MPPKNVWASCMQYVGAMCQEYAPLTVWMMCRAAERVQTATATGWKQAQQGLKGFVGGPLLVLTHFPSTPCMGALSRCPALSLLSLKLNALPYLAPG